MKKIIITGVAGFIGSEFAYYLLKRGYEVIGIDNLCSDGDVLLELKQTRLVRLINYENFQFIKADIRDITANSLLQYEEACAMIHLAANAGVKMAKKNAIEYIDNNIAGFYNMIEISRLLKIQHFIYASSSSVYGNNRMDTNKNNQELTPKSIYAITKVTDEFIARLYSDNYKLKTTGLRFFSVYGPYGRPDMAPWIFSDSILHKKKIKLANNGNVYRDFTYVCDIVKAISLVVEENRDALYSIYDIGATEPCSIKKLVEIIEREYCRKANYQSTPLMVEEAKYTIADMSFFLMTTHILLLPQ